MSEKRKACLTGTRAQAALDKQYQREACHRHEASRDGNGRIPKTVADDYPAKDCAKRIAKIECASIDRRGETRCFGRRLHHPRLHRRNDGKARRTEEKEPDGSTDMTLEKSGIATIMRTSARRMIRVAPMSDQSASRPPRPLPRVKPTPTKTRTNMTKPLDAPVRFASTGATSRWR